MTENENMNLNLDIPFILLFTIFIGCSKSNGPSTWFTQIGSTNFDTCKDIKADSYGNIYCAGNTTGPLGENISGSSDAFIMKMTNSGSL